MNNTNHSKSIPQRARHHICRWCLLPLLWVLALPAAVEAQFTYTTNNGTITITGYFGPGGAVTIPNTINGLPVTTIGDSAFRSASPTSVTIPDDVSSIGDAAFFGCYALTSVMMGTNVGRIGQGAFWGCSSLTGVNIPNSVTNLGFQAFFQCSSLTSVIISKNITDIPPLTFYSCAKLTNLAIPNGVSRIGDSAFQFCTSLTNVTIPNSVISIGNAAFDSCWSLTSVMISRGVTNIGSYAFQACRSLTAITVDELNSFYSSSAGVLLNKSQTTFIQYPPGLTGSSYTISNRVTSIGIGAFEGCTRLTSVTIPDSVTSIGEYAFDGCTSLTSLTLPYRLSSIADGAFSGCGLTNLSIPDSVTSIGTDAFGGCTSLTSVSIGSGVTGIGIYAFDGCSSLTNVMISASVTSIGIDAFLRCPRLVAITVDALNLVYSSLDGVLFNNSQTTLIECPEGKGPSYTIPNGVTSIGERAFDTCSSLTNVVIPNSVTSIGDSAFAGCQSLTDIVLPNSVTSIGEGVFNECDGLTSITIPSSVTFIGAGAFYGCDGLRSITIPDGVTMIGDGTFEGCTSLASVAIPSRVSGIGLAAFESCTSLTNVTIGSRVTNIGDSAFYYCTMLRGVYFSGNAPSLGGGSVFAADSATIYYLPGTTGWGMTFGGLPTALWQRPAEVYTLPATAVTRTNATLNGMVNPNGWPTTAWFQWGPTTNYGNLTLVTGMGSGTNALALSAPLSGLSPRATYHFQAAASNSSGVGYGDDQSFSTWGLLQVSTLSATAVTPTNATLNGTVNPDGWPTTAWFEWGTTTTYGNFTPVTNMGTGTTALAFSAPLAGLTPGTIYHFRAAATNVAGVVYGSDQSFISMAPTFTDAKWVSLGFGINGSVKALATSGTNLYAGGDFDTVGGVSAYKIAKWNGSAWSALGSGFYGSGDVRALAVSGTDLYASGFFATAGGVPANNIAKWNGSAWSALGPGLAGRVYALAVMGTDLYAGGGFITGGGMSAINVAKWDGNTWSALGSGMGGGAFYADVRALAVSGTNLYAGGFFTTAGGVSANYIAKWDGSAWSAVGSGMGGSFLNPEVAALAVSGTDLYAGGDFTTAGGVTVNGIAKWTGSAWSALGPGMNSTVYALAMDGTDLYAGGQFTTAGGLSAANIAKWDGSAWSALGSGLSTSVYALAADGRGHLFVGGAFGRAGTNACLFLAQANLGSPPAVLASPPTQTAETGAAVNLAVDAAGDPPPRYQWYFNGTNLLSCTSSKLVLTNILFSQSGTYMVVLTNKYGAVTSAPVMLDVIPTVERRPVPGLQFMGEAGGLLNLDVANPLSSAPDWLPLDTVTLASAPQYYFDLTVPLPPQRFYRAWQTGTPSVTPALDLHFVPAIMLTGGIGHSVRVDYINQVGPTDAWFTLDTVTLTNTSQLYFDTSAWQQPPRLYRLVQIP